MLKMTLYVEGMACSMCEAHVNDVIRKNFSVKKVTSSHSKKQTEIICEEAIDEAALMAAIAATGYEFKGVTTAPYEKKGLFSAFRK